MTMMAPARTTVQLPSRLDLTPGPAAVPQARRHVGRQYRGWGKIVYGRFQFFCTHAVPVMTAMADESSSRSRARGRIILSVRSGPGFRAATGPDSMGDLRKSGPRGFTNGCRLRNTLPCGQRDHELDR